MMCINCESNLERILLNLKNCNDGANIHEVSTMRHLASILIYIANKGKKDEYVCSETKKLNDRMTVFFKNKFYSNQAGQHPH